MKRVEMIKKINKYCEHNNCSECDCYESESCYLPSKTKTELKRFMKKLGIWVEKSKDIKIKYFDGAEPLEIIDKGDWIDLKTNKGVSLRAGEYLPIPLGVAMELPKGYESIIAPRSSTFKHYGILLANSIGVIDESYCGDNDQWHFLAYATRDTIIPSGARICQFHIIKHQPVIRFNTVSHLDNEDRGGIGSTGK